MKIIISLKEKHLKGFLKQNKLIKEVVDSFQECESCCVQICSQDCAINCERKRKHLFINFIGNDK